MAGECYIKTTHQEEYYSSVTPDDLTLGVETEN